MAACSISSSTALCRTYVPISCLPIDNGVHLLPPLMAAAFSLYTCTDFCDDGTQQQVIDLLLIPLLFHHHILAMTHVNRGESVYGHTM